MGRRGLYSKGVDIVLPGTKDKHGLDLWQKSFRLIRPEKMTGTLQNKS